MIIGQPKKFSLFIQNEANPIERCKREAKFWADAMSVLSSTCVKDASSNRHVIVKESGIWSITDFDNSRIVHQAYKMTPNPSIEYTEIVDVKQLFLASQNIWYRMTFFPHQTSFQQFTKDEQFKNDEQSAKDKNEDFKIISIPQNYLQEAYDKFIMPGSEYKFDFGDDNEVQRKAKLFDKFKEQFETFFYSEEEKKQ